jgi:undecaprenyl-diphosphatase
MWKAAAVAIFAFLPLASVADCLWSRIDHVPSYSASGPWNAKVYRGITDGAAVLDAGGAIWEGADSRIGRTMWQSLDAMAASSLAVQAGKSIFTRARPTQGGDPCLWFQGGSHYSFPGGEAAFSASLVTPFVLEYARDKPATYALLLLPAYVGVARMKNHAHWPSDVVAGWAIGSGIAWWDHGRETPFSVSILPRGLTIGFRTQF